MGADVAVGVTQDITIVACGVRPTRVEHHVPWHVGLSVIHIIFADDVRAFDYSRVEPTVPGTSPTGIGAIDIAGGSSCERHAVCGAVLQCLTVCASVERASQGRGVLSFPEAIHTAGDRRTDIGVVDRNLTSEVCYRCTDGARPRARATSGSVVGRTSICLATAGVSATRKTCRATADIAPISQGAERPATTTCEQIGVAKIFLATVYPWGRPRQQ